MRDEIYAFIRKFDPRFVALPGAASWRDLFRVDLNTQECRAIHAQKNLRETVCTPCVKDAAQIVEELHKEKS